MLHIKKLLETDHFYVLIKQIAIILSGVISLFCITRTLGPSLKGEYSYIINISNIILSFGNLGISHLFPKEIKQSNSDRTYCQFMSISWFLCFVGLLICFLCFKLDKFDIRPLIIAIFSVLSLHFNMYAMIFDIKANSLNIFVVSIVSSLCYCFLWFLGYRNVNVFLSIYVIKLLLTVALNIRLLGLCFRLNLVSLRIIIKGFIPALTLGLISLNYNVDVYMLKKLNSSMQNIGIYTTSVSLASYVWLFVDVFKQVLIKQNIHSIHKRNITRSLLISCLLVIVSFFCFLFLGNKIVLLWFGKSFIQVYTITLYCFLPVFFMTLTKVISSVIIVEGRWNFFFIVMFGASVINVVLNLFLIPLYGMYGAIIASFVSYFFSAMLSSIWFAFFFKE